MNMQEVLSYNFERMKSLRAIHREGAPQRHWPIAYPLPSTLHTHQPTPNSSWACSLLIKPKESSLERGLGKFKDVEDGVKSSSVLKRLDDCRYSDSPLPGTKPVGHDCSAAFTPIRFSISIQPQISGELLVGDIVSGISLIMSRGSIIMMRSMKKGDHYVVVDEGSMGLKRSRISNTVYY
jgi:hypothetical protein